ncbi:hypothetical protein D3C76_1388990 [compost metagenome]
MTCLSTFRYSGSKMSPSVFSITTRTELPRPRNDLRFSRKFWIYGWLCGIIFSKLGRNSRRVTIM